MWQTVPAQRIRLWRQCSENNETATLGKQALSKRGRICQKMGMKLSIPIFFAPQRHTINMFFVNLQKRIGIMRKSICTIQERIFKGNNYKSIQLKFNYL